jgi:hypothetical protein
MTAEKLSDRPYRYQQAPETTSNYRLGTSSYTNVRSAAQHLFKQDKHMNGSRTYANPDKYDVDTNTTEERCFSRQLYIE